MNVQTQILESSIACIALGSNIGDRRATIHSAVSCLRETDGITVVAVSDLMETAAHGPVKQENFLNAAAKLRTCLSPAALLDRCLAIERAHGRDRSSAVRWGPRTLDIDLLLYGSLILDEPDLRIPHPRMNERFFVLEPLAQIAPDEVHPVTGESIQSTLDRLRLRQTAGPR